MFTATNERSRFIFETSSKSLGRKTVNIVDFMRYFIEITKKADAKGSYI